MWFAWYRHHYGTRTLTLLALSLGGESSEKIDEFDRLRTVLVNLVLEAGHRNIRPAKAISAAGTVTVTSTSRQMVSVEEDDDHVELEYYKTEYKGGLEYPLLNGLGHRVGKIDGQLGVIVPGPPMKKVKRAKQQIADVNTMQDDGSMSIRGEDHSSAIAAAIFQGFSLSSRASGSSPSGLSRFPAVQAFGAVPAQQHRISPAFP